MKALIIFDNPTLESLCEQLLRPEELKYKTLKDLHGDGPPVNIPSSSENLEGAKRNLEMFERYVSRLKTAISLGELAMQLNSKLKEVE